MAIDTKLVPTIRVVTQDRDAPRRKLKSEVVFLRVFAAERLTIAFPRGNED